MRISTAYMFDQNLAAMLNKQGDLTDTQLQISTGKRLITPSDDPVSAVDALNLEREHNLAEQHIANSDRANNKLRVEEGALKSATNILQRIRQLAVQGLSDTNNKSDRISISKEVLELNQQLLALSNTQDSSGNYVFSGFKTDTQPYTSIGSSYAGDSGQRHMQVGAGVTVATNDVGSQIFEAKHVQTRVTDNASPSSAALNITAIGKNSSITSPITVSFASAGNTLTITDGSTTETISPYTAGDSVELSSLNTAFPDFTLQMDGTLANGDSYTLSTQTTANQTIFKTINDFAQGLTQDKVGSNDSPNNGDFLTNISTAMNQITDVRAEIGARLNVVEQQQNITSELAVTMKKTLSEIQDLDYAEAISRLTQQTVGLQAAQQSFARVQNLSLFNYL